MTGKSILTLAVLAALTLGTPSSFALKLLEQSDFSTAAYSTSKQRGPTIASQWQEFIESHIFDFDRQKINAANKFINTSIRLEIDLENWGIEDYWASPVESFVKGKGDCEDYAIAKYFILKDLSIPAEKLRLAYVLVNLREAHMVLLVEDQGEQLVLDNLTAEARLLQKRPDLTLIYSFNETGTWSSVSTPFEKTRLKNQWAELLRKMQSEINGPDLNTATLQQSNPKTP